MEYNHRFQNALLASVDRQVVEMESRVREKDMALISAEQSRVDLGVSVHRLTNELNRSRAELRAQKGLQASVMQLQRDATSSLVASRVKLQKKNKQEKALREDLLDTREKLTSLQNNTQNMQMVLNRYKDELKIVRGNEKLLEVELIARNESLAESRNDVKVLHKKIRRAKYNTNVTTQKLKLQEGETKVAHRRLEKVAGDLHSVSASKTLLLRQWQDALRAMSVRDEALQVAEKMRNKLSEEVLKLNNDAARSGSIEAENTHLNKKIGMMENNIHAIQQRCNATIIENQRLLQKQVELRKGLEVEHATSSKMRGSMEILVKENEKLQQSLNNATHQLKQADTAGKRLTRSHCRGIVHAKEAIAKERRISAEHADRANKQILVYRRDRIRAQNVAQKKSVHTAMLMHALDANKKENDSLAQSAIQMRLDNRKLSEKAGQLQRAVPRMEHVINKLHLELHELRRNDSASTSSASLMARVHRLNGLARDKDEKFRAMRRQWYTAHDSFLQAQSRHFKSKDDIEKLRGNVSSLMSVNGRLAKHHVSLKRDNITLQAESDFTRSKLRKANSTQHNLKSEILSLKRENEDYKALINIRGKEQKAGTDILRIELGVTRARLKNVSKVQRLHAMDRRALERRYVLCCQELQQKNSKLDSALRAGVELRAELNRLKVDNAAASKSFEQRLKCFKIRYGKTHHRIDDGARIEMGDMQISNNYDNVVVSEGRDLVANMSLQLNRLNTIAAERLDELVKLKHKLNQVQDRNAVIEDQLARGKASLKAALAHIELLRSLHCGGQVEGQKQICSVGSDDEVLEIDGVEHRKLPAMNPIPPPHPAPSTTSTRKTRAHFL